MVRLASLIKKEWFLLVVLGMIFMLSILTQQSHSSPATVSVPHTAIAK